MGQRYFSRCWLTASTTDKSGARCAVMRRTKGRHVRDGTLQTHRSLDESDLNGGFVIEPGQQPGKAMGEHRLSTSRRSKEEEMMPSCCRDLQGTPGH
jgi:hypothetical protein